MKKFTLPKRSATTAIVPAKPSSMEKLTEPKAIFRATKLEEGFNDVMKGAVELLQKFPTPGMAGAVADLFKRMEENIKDMRKQARDTLLAYVEKNGEDDPESDRTRVAEAKLGQRTFRFKRQVHKYTEPDHNLLKSLLKEKFELVKGNLEEPMTEDQFIHSAFTTQITEVVDMDAVQQLVDGGLITAEELEQCRREKSTNLIIEG